MEKDSCQGEKWERIIEHELHFYINIQEYENKLLERLYESQRIQYPGTIFDEEEGRVYLSGPNTEDQALYRMEVRESIEALLKKAVKRINRLNNALAQLSEKEQDVISIFYFERDLPVLHMARTLGFSTQNEFMKKKETVLKKLFSIYEKERSDAHEDFRKALKEERIKKAHLFRTIKAV
ncbi:hypothetical protein V7182_23780 [Neobacillus drentensis]|uniref:hypothetical protein n=1 Tax=Neobacillus drentensis TaxID=220684 RepID=UPI002FFEA13A